MENHSKAAPMANACETASIGLFDILDIESTCAPSRLQAQKIN